MESTTVGVGLYLIPFAVGNVLGPLTIGRLFDTIGRRVMITFTYITSGVLLAITGWLFAMGVLDATTQTIAWCVIFFFASAGTSSAYLTVSEIFPLEIRAVAIALFYAVGTGAGGFIGPVLFGALIQTATAMNVFYGYLLGATLMVVAGIVEAIRGVEAARRSIGGGRRRAAVAGRFRALTVAIGKVQETRGNMARPCFSVQ
jgi:MFS family permease